jgi:hypothetical protein
MDELEKDVLAAKAAGMSYGRWRAMQGFSGPCTGKNERKRKKGAQPKFTTEEAFLLWKAGNRDSQIARYLGVSRQSIQKWRGLLELPSNARSETRTERFALVKINGEFYAVRSEDEG